VDRSTGQWEQSYNLARLGDAPLEGFPIIILFERNQTEPKFVGLGFDPATNTFGIPGLFPQPFVPGPLPFPTVYPEAFSAGGAYYGWLHGHDGFVYVSPWFEQYGTDPEDNQAVWIAPWRAVELGFFSYTRYPPVVKGVDYLGYVDDVSSVHYVNELAFFWLLVAEHPDGDQYGYLFRRELADFASPWQKVYEQYGAEWPEDIVKLPSGRLVLLSGQASGWGPAFTLTSDDNGVTWTKNTHVNFVGIENNASVVMDSGRIVALRGDVRPTTHLLHSTDGVSWTMTQPLIGGATWSIDEGNVITDGVRLLINTNNNPATNPNSRARIGTEAGGAFNDFVDVLQPPDIPLRYDGKLQWGHFWAAFYSVPEEGWYVPYIGRVEVQHAPTVILTPHVKLYKYSPDMQTILETHDIMAQLPTLHNGNENLFIYSIGRYPMLGTRSPDQR
jgi:hypothetical protein